jgi:hypothetical protein
VREAPAEPRPAAAVKLYVVTEFVDLDPEAVEFDLVLPIVPRRHRRGALGMVWLENFKNTLQW